jgi:hypothetical protein
MTVEIETEGRAIRLVVRRVVPMDVTDGDIERARLQVEREVDKAFGKIGQVGIPAGPKKKPVRSGGTMPVKKE